MKIYTKTGDEGTTSLLGGTRVKKSDQRINAYGSVDELNSFVGLLRSRLNEEGEILKGIQNKLFNIGSNLAKERELKLKIPQINERDVEKLEEAMDKMDEALPTLRNFVLAGGSENNALAHVCRSICRRAEREIIDLDEKNSLIIKYLNRLSDYFFVLSRFILKAEGVEEEAWSKD